MGARLGLHADVSGVSRLYQALLETVMGEATQAGREKVDIFDYLVVKSGN